MHVPELGYCIGKCKNMQKCFFLKDYFICGHFCCYNIASKLMCCIKCGNNKFRYRMTDNREEIIMNHTIIKTIYCYCVKC